MISEGLLGAFSLIKLKRDILWLGRQNEEPPKELGRLVSRIQFNLLENVKPSNVKNHYSILVVSPGAEPSDLQPLADFLRTNFKTGCQKFLVLDQSQRVVPPAVLHLMNQARFHQILVFPEDKERLAQLLEDALEKKERQRAARDERKKVKSANAELESRASDLELVIRERTSHIQAAKKEIDQKVSRIRGLIRFLKELSTVVSVEDLLLLLRKEARAFHHVKDPLLVFMGPHKGARILYFQGAEVLEKSHSRLWPDMNRIRLNDTRDSQFLADLFGRPFARILAIPLSIHRSGGQTDSMTPAVLYFEHSLDETSRLEFISFLEERLQAISVAMDRLFLEADMTEASVLWERTFDGIADPIVIFDADGHLVRSNRAFQENLLDVESHELMQESLRHKGRIYDVHSYPVASSRGAVATNVVVHYVDVTLAHHLQKQMIQQEKMAALGHLAGNIAHELNNPLTGVRSLAQVMVQQLSSESRVRADLIEVEKAAERCQGIIRNLLEFSRGGVENQLQEISLSEIVRKTLPLLKTLLSRFQTEIVLTEEPDLVSVEPQLLQQVVFNLVKNAGQAMASGEGVLSIHTRVQGDEVSLDVRDTGVGISPEIQSQIFDFFFTTKEQGQGTGLGLSMSKTIVDSFGGRISVESEVRKGSCFRVVLPRVKQQKEPL